MSNQRLSTRHDRHPGARLGRSGRIGLAALVGFVSVLVFVCAVANAGSVFMKNGYIIQGNIVERDEASVVLGWSNGKVSIARRFIEAVAYDPGEEKRLEDEDSLRKQKVDAAADDATLLATSNDTMIELPSTLEELMQTYGHSGQQPGGGGNAQVPPGGATPPQGGDGSTPTINVPVGPNAGQGTGVTTPVVVLRPDDQLGERVNDADRALSLRPPKGWTALSTEAAFQVYGQRGPDGFRPSINVVAFPKGPLGTTEYVELLKEENGRSMKDFEVLHEGPRKLGSQDAYEIVGRGSHRGTTAFVRQLLVPGAEKLWFVSAFTKDQDASGAFSLTEESLKSLEFSAQ